MEHRRRDSIYCEPGTDSGAAEENIENTAAVGLEQPLSHLAETLEQDKKRRRHRGGRQLKMTPDQRKAHRKAKGDKLE